jgi:hypothetical protein
VKSDAKITDTEMEEYKEFIIKYDQKRKTDFSKYIDNEHMSVNTFELLEKSTAKEARKYKIYSIIIKKYKDVRDNYENITYGIKNISNLSDNTVFLTNYGEDFLLGSKDFFQYKTPGKLFQGRGNFENSRMFDYTYNIQYLPQIGDLMLSNRPTEA